MAIANGLKMGHVANMVAPYPTIAKSTNASPGPISPRLFDSAMLKRVVGLVQRWLP